MSMRLFPFCLVVLFTIAFTIDAFAVTRTVRKDGTGDFTTVGAAVAAAGAGDVIEVGPGIYPEKVDVFVTLTFVSTNGAAATIMDGEGTHYPLWFRAATDHIVDGFTFRNGYHVSGGGAIRCQAGATLTIRNSVIEQNVSEYDGGGFFTRDAGSFIDAYDCVFRQNHAEHNAGAGIAILGSRINYTRCRFFGNTCGLFSGAVTAHDSFMDINQCLFVGNSSEVTCGAIYYYGSSGNVVGNTVHANSSVEWGSMLFQGSYNLTVSRNIVSSDAIGAGMALLGSATHSCNVFWNNAGGSIVGGVLSSDEVEADPVFCDAASGDYTISIHSPAAPANSACAQLIGAYPTNCDIEPPPPPPPPVIEPVILSIADVPNDQGRQVRIRWERCDHDAPNQPFVITGYAVYRYQGNFARMLRPDASVGRGRDVAIDGWDYITTVPARGDEIYQVVAPTLCDTPKNGDPCYSIFFVSAMTPDPLEFFDSAPDTGESIDNLPPGPPGAVAVAASESGITVSWESPGDEDVVRYFIYKTYGSDPLGDPLHVTEDLEWTDPNGSMSARYWVAAVDDANNVGEPAGTEPTTDVEFTPSSSFLKQNAPNPFNPSTTIEFGIPTAGAGNVKLEIFDVTGRRVRTLLNETRGAGTWRVAWNGVTDEGTRASSGVYFYRLQAPGFQQTRRMTLVE